MTQRRIYQDECPYFITVRTRDSSPLFEQTKYARLLSSIIFFAGKIEDYDIFSYQIMSDHLHLLVDKIKNASAPTERCAWGRGSGHFHTNPEQVSVPANGAVQYNISQLMYTIKSYFVKEVRDQYDILSSIWQKRFYSHIITTPKYLATVIQYIKQNSIKENLPPKYHQFSYQYINWELLERLQLSHNQG